MAVLSKFKVHKTRPVTIKSPRTGREITVGEAPKQYAAPKLTGTANALTRGKGLKLGLKKQAITPPPAPSTAAPSHVPARQFAAPIKPGALNLAPPSGSSWKKPGPAPTAVTAAVKQMAARQAPTKLTGRANALTRGQGKKIGLRKPRTVAVKGGRHGKTIYTKKVAKTYKAP